MSVRAEVSELSIDEAQVREKRILVDAHVHLHPCFELATSFAAAWNNFTAVLPAEPFAGLLLLAEACGEDLFRELANLADRGDRIGSRRAATWAIKRTSEAESLELIDHSGERRLFLIAGRQVRTREGLEVLAVGSLEAPRDGIPLREAIAGVRAADALPVIPWGFGKWWSRRGSLLTAVLEQSEGELFLGDNGGRPAIYREPRHFDRARRRGIPILPGSDPFPLASEALRLGSYGFSFEACIDRGAPCRALKREVRRESFDPRRFGAGAAPLSFARNQLFMQSRERRFHAAHRETGS